MSVLRVEGYFPRLLDMALAAAWGKRPLPHPSGTAEALSDGTLRPSPSLPAAQPHHDPPVLPGRTAPEVKPTQTATVPNQLIESASNDT